MKPTEQECTAIWRELLTKFNVLTYGNPAPGKIRTELLELKNEVKNSILPALQVDSLSRKVDGYLLCRYGNAKK